MRSLSFKFIVRVVDIWHQLYNLYIYTVEHKTSATKVLSQRHQILIDFQSYLFH